MKVKRSRADGSCLLPQIERCPAVQSDAQRHRAVICGIRGHDGVPSLSRDVVTMPFSTHDKTRINCVMGVATKMSSQRRGAATQGHTGVPIVLLGCDTIHDVK